MNEFYVGDVVMTSDRSKAVVVSTDRAFNGGIDDGVIICREGFRNVMVHKYDLVLVEKVDPKEYLKSQVTEALRGTLVCTRSWSAWSLGTMSEEDFSLACEDDDLVNSIVETVIQSLGILNRK